MHPVLIGVHLSIVWIRRRLDYINKFRDVNVPNEDYWEAPNL